MGIIDPLHPRKSLKKVVKNVCKLSYKVPVYQQLKFAKAKDEEE